MYNIWVAIIIAIIILIVILCFNAVFIYFPVQRIERKVDSIIPEVKQATGGINSVIPTTERTETKIDNLIATAGCIFCRSFLATPEFCDGDVLRPASQICIKTP